LNVVHSSYNHDQQKTKLQNNAVRTTKDAVMLLFMHKPLRNAVMFCAFKNIHEMAAASMVCWEQ
jgi:hypothetical protein